MLGIKGVVILFEARVIAQYYFVELVMVVRSRVTIVIVGQLVKPCLKIQLEATTVISTKSIQKTIAFVILAFLQNKWY